MNFYELQFSDIGKRNINAFGTVHSIGSLLGYVRKTDVGKRIYRSDAGVLSVENDEQLAARLAPI